MLNYKIKIYFRTFGDLERIKLVQSIEYNQKKLYLAPIHQLVCLHHPKINRVYAFKKRKAYEVILRQDEFEKFYGVEHDELVFQQPLMSDQQYHQRHSVLTQPEIDLLNSHLTGCSVCRFWNRPIKTIRRRPKINKEALKLAHDIGVGHSNRVLQDEYQISKTALTKFKRKLTCLNSQPQPKHQLKKQRKFTSLTTYEQEQIEQKIETNVFTKISTIHQDLRLPCAPQTVHNYVKAIKYRRFLANETISLNKLNQSVKAKFASLVSGFSREHLECILFCDEKTLFSGMTSNVFVYRKRGQRNQRKFRFFRNLQTAIKVNLFGYITPNGVGDIFVFSNYTDQIKFINYMHYEVIPSIREKFGDRFALVLDNAGIHKAKLCLEYYHRVNLNVLIWAPQTPEWNVIKNVWSILSKRVNQHVFDHGPVNRRADLAKLAFDVWYGIEKSIIVNLYDAFLKRIRNFLADLPADA